MRVVVLKRTLPALAMLALAAAHAPLRAQGGERAIEEVVVTATKRETNLMETALSVSSLSQEALDAAGVRNVLDIGEMVPNMLVAISPEDSGVQVTVRGLSSNNFTEIGDPTVAMHFDGLYSPRPQGGLALMYDVERTEINRGPQGTLFGRNSTAGSINVISARPQFDEFSGQFEAEVGAYAQRTIKGWLNVPLSDRWAFRASGFAEKADSWLNQSVDRFDLDWDTNGDGDTDDPFDVPADGIPNVDQRRAQDVGDSQAYGAVERYGARLGFRFQPNDQADWNIIYDFFSDQSPGYISLKDCEKAENTFFECDHGQWDIAVNVPGKTDMTIHSLRSVFEYELTDSVALEYRIALAKQERSQLSDGSIAYASPAHPAYGIPRNFYDSASMGRIDFGNLVRDQGLLDSLGYPNEVLQPFEDLQLETAYSDYSSVVQELQLKSQGGGKLQWIGGLFLLSEDNEIRFNVEIPFCCGNILPLAQSFVQPERTIDSFATFLQLDYQVIDRLNFTAGIRHTNDQKEDRNGSNYVTTGFNQPNVGLYDPDFATGGQFDYLGWTFIGINPTSEISDGKGPYQSDALTLEDGTLGAGFLERLQRSDNSHKGSWDSVTWKLGVDFLLNDDIFFYGYAATGFKSGGFGDAVDICDCNIVTAFDYEPEENLTYELGVKSSWLDGELNVIASIFYSDNQDLQQTFYAIVTSNGEEIAVPAGYNDAENRTAPCSNGEGLCVVVDRDIGTLLTDNIAEAVNYGAEIEFDWYAWPGGRVNGWVAYLDSEITEYEGYTDNWYCLERALFGLSPCAEPDPNNLDDGGNPLRTGDIEGNALPWSPKWSVTVNVEHNFHFGELRLSPYLSVHWQDVIYFDNSNFDEGPFHSGQPAYATADFALRLINETDAWGAEFYVRNITNEHIRTWGDRGPGFMRATFAKPRHFGLKFNKVF